MMKKRTIYALSAVLALSACGTPGMLKRVDGNYERARDAARELRAGDDAQVATRRDVLEHVSGAWVARRSVALADRDVLPSMFDSPASFVSGRPLPMSMVTAEIARAHGINIGIARDVFDHNKPIDAHADSDRDRYRQGYDVPSPESGAQEPQVLVDYTGTLRGLLNTLTGTSGTHWDYRDGTVQIARLRTRTFQIKAMPGTSSYSATVGKKADAKAENKSGVGGGGDQGMKLNFGAETRIAMDSELNYWDELVAAVTRMLSPAGSVTPSTATNSLTVTDIAAVVDRVAAYVDAENAVLARQVRLRVQVYSVQLTEESRAGVDWKLAFRASGGQFAVAGPSSDSVTSIGQAGGTVTTGRFNDSKLFLQALSKQGRSANVIDTTVVTLNNQPAPVAVTENEGYVAKVEISQGSLGSGSLSTATQAMLTTGFVMNLLPTLLDNRSVMLQVQVDMSQKKDLKTFSTQHGLISSSASKDSEKTGNGGEENGTGGGGGGNRAIAAHVVCPDHAARRLEGGRNPGPERISTHDRLGQSHRHL